MTQISGEEQAAKPAKGNLADLLAQTEVAPAHAIGLDVWIKIGVIAALFLIVHAWQLQILGRFWQTPDWQHGWAIPLFAIYLIYVRRKEILSVPRRGLHPSIDAINSGQGSSGGYFTPKRTMLFSGIYLAAISAVLLGAWGYFGESLWNACWAQASWFRRGLFLIPFAIGGIGLFNGLYRWKNLGLPIIIVAIVMEMLGYYPICIGYMFHTGMILLLFGVVLYMGGRPLAAVLALPIWFLMFAMPLPGYVHNEIAFALQNYAAAGSVAILKVFNVELQASASALDITSIGGNNYPLVVAEACSGIRSLMAYPALCVAFTYLEYRPIWQRLILVLAIVPVTIFVNVLRVALTASMFVWDKPEWGKDFMHEVLGIVMLIPTLLVMMGILWIMNRIFVDSDEDEAQEATNEASGEAKAAV